MPIINKHDLSKEAGAAPGLETCLLASAGQGSKSLHIEEVTVAPNLQLIAERGRMGWQRASGYNWRALVEADIGRYKRVIGDALRSRTKGRQTTEVAIAATSLNRMLELGRPEYLRLS